MTDSTEHALSPQDCLVALMIAVSASDENIRTAELVKIESTVNHLPVFADYDADRIKRDVADCLRPASSRRTGSTRSSA